MTGEAMRAAGLWCLPLALLALVSALSASPAHAADPQPVLVYQSPTEGPVIQQPAFGIQLCFASPVNFKDMGGDFAFTVTEPDGLGLGNRDVFQPDGYGITIYLGKPIGETTGQWKFHDRLTSPDAKSSSGTATASPTPEPGATTPAAVSASPAPASGHSSASAIPNASPIAAGSNSSGPDILKYSLLTIGAAGAAGVILLIGYLVRRRVGYDPHREKPGGDEHH